MADIVRLHGSDYLASRGGVGTGTERRVLRAISSCRTSLLGGHVDRCNQCGHTAISYNSCRNRHCPKCQAAARYKWMEDRESELLPIPYFHVVFTLPKEVAAIARQNPKTVYGLLFSVSAETIRQVASDPAHLGAEVGILSVLHTWGQSLQHHPHVHCIVSGGGLADKGQRWVSSRPDFFVSVRVLSRLFRGKFLDRLKRVYRSGGLKLKGSIEALNSPSAFARFCRPLYAKKWVVYSKRPFGGPSRVLKYLARYTHRVAISNARLVKLEKGRVSFLWRDYAHKSRRRVMTLSAVEFLRRFLMHTLPSGFVRIRHYGFLANRYRKKKLAQCRELLNVATPSADKEPAPVNDRPRCPSCAQGLMHMLWQFDLTHHPKCVPIDSS